MKTLKLGLEFWTKDISFYLFTTGFKYKRNPMDQAHATTAREWRLVNEGTELGCTSIGKKERTTQAKFMVAISCNSGVLYYVSSSQRE